MSNDNDKYDLNLVSKSGNDWGSPENTVRKRELNKRMRKDNGGDKVNVTNKLIIVMGIIIISCILFSLIIGYTTLNTDSQFVELKEDLNVL